MDQATRDGITLGIALLGAVLGVMNLWRAIDRDRIRLRVIPQAYYHSHGYSGLCIEVINLGFTPVTVTSVGFLVSGGDQLIVPGLSLNLATGEHLPRRLESRAAFTAYIPPGTEDNRQFGEVTAAFAKTACGRRFKGKSGALRQRAKKARRHDRGPGMMGLRSPARPE